MQEQPQVGTGLETVMANHGQLATQGLAWYTDWVCRVLIWQWGSAENVFTVDTQMSQCDQIIRQFFKTKDPEFLHSKLSVNK